MKKISGENYRLKVDKVKGHSMFALTIRLDGMVTVICAKSKDECVYIAKSASYINPIDEDLIQEVVITDANAWEVIK